MATAVATAVAWVLVATGTVTGCEANDGIRLPLEVLPRRYRIDITPELEDDFRFHGEVWIEVEAMKPERRITLHVGRGLNVDFAGLSLHLLRQAEASGPTRRHWATEAAAGARGVGDETSENEQLLGAASTSDSTPLASEPTKKRIQTLAVPSAVGESTGTAVEVNRAALVRNESDIPKEREAEQNATVALELSSEKTQSQEEFHTSVEEAGLVQDVVEKTDEVERVDDSVKDLVRKASGDVTDGKDVMEETAKAGMDADAVVGDVAEETDGTEVEQTMKAALEDVKPVVDDTEETARMEDVENADEHGSAGERDVAEETDRTEVEQRMKVGLDDAEPVVDDAEETARTEDGDARERDVAEETTGAEVDGAEVDGAAGAAEREAERAVAVEGADASTHAQRVALLLAEALQPGRLYRLHLAFNGSLSDDLTGFYKVSFREGNRTRWIATSVFEPAEARRAFPCFDEPALKAHFQVNVGRPRDLTALSNMPLEVTEPMDGRSGWVWDRFAQSPLMAPYLVAWAVGPLRSRCLQAEGCALRVWARAEALQDAEYALQAGARIQRALREWLDEPEPLPKTDLLALPAFVSDALENWGLVSFGERFLLASADSPAAKSRVGFILGHELAHSYFGNLVTLAWWDAIWLNEGFATYFGALALAQAEPRLEVEATTAVRAFLEVFAADALRSSHALTAAAAATSDLYQIFDSITYYKGYYVLRMLNHSLGEHTFRRGVQRYVREHRWGSVRERDLWAALGRQARRDGVPLPAGGDLGRIMHAWTRRPGYPLLQLTRDYATGGVSLTQERFLRAPGDTEKALEGADGAVGGAAGASGGRWWVPLTLTWAGGPLGWEATRPRLWLDPARANVSLPALPLGPDDWLLANVHAAGLYRVNYDARNWALLAEALRLNASALPLLNRALVLDDALDLARAGRLPYATALDLLRYLRSERALAPWLAALGDLDYLRRMLPPSTNTGRALQRFLLRLVGPRWERLGLSPVAGEPAEDALARRLLARWACALAHPRCVRDALARFSDWRRHPDTRTLTADLRGVVLCAAVEHGGAAEWSFLWERFANASSAAERSGVLAALGCSRHAPTLRRFLMLSIEKDSPIRKQQSAAVFEAVAKNPVGHAVALQFLKDNIDRILGHVGINPFHLPQLFQALAYRMNTPDELLELERLQTEQRERLRAATRALQQTREAVRFNIEWMRRHRAHIACWLANHDAARPSTTHTTPQARSSDYTEEASVSTSVPPQTTTTLSSNSEYSSVTHQPSSFISTTFKPPTSVSNEYRFPEQTSTPETSLEFRPSFSSVMPDNFTIKSVSDDTPAAV